MTNDGKEFEFGTSVHDKAKYIESLFKNDTTLNTSSVQEGDGVRNQSTPPSFELSNEHDQSIHVQPYADMIDKLTYVQKADFAKRAVELERDCATYKKMYEEICKERNGWISEYRAARAEVERLKQRLSEVEDDYEDICKLTYDVAVPCRREWLIEQVGEENWERFKNHMGW